MNKIIKTVYAVRFLWFQILTEFTTQESCASDLQYTQLFKAIRAPFNSIYFYFTLKLDYTL